MNLKKSTITGLALALAIGVTGCMNKDEGLDKAYVDQYSGYYTTYLDGIGNYSVYDTPDLAIEYYNNYDYPGNEGYVDELRTSYTGSRDSIQKFIDSIENDMKTDDDELTQMNRDLVEKGRQNVENINARLEKLDALPEEIYEKEQNEFIKAVDESTKTEVNTKSEFIELLNNMNARLNVDISNNHPNK